MSESAPKSKRLSFQLLREKWGPLVVSVASFCLILWLQQAIIGRFSDGVWSLDNLYTSIFDWAAIQTGFLFGVYGFVVGKTDGFIKELRGSIALDRFLLYVKRASKIGFALTFISMPLIVWDPDITVEPRWVFIVVAAWFSIFIWSFLAFVRVAYIFGLIVQVKDKKEIRG